MTDNAHEDAEHKVLKAQLLERSAIIDGALDGIVVIDDCGTVLEFNRAAEAMFGYPREEAIGSHIVELIIPDKHRAHHEAGFDNYVAGRSTARMIGQRIETEARRKCGEMFPVELTIIEAVGTGRQVFAGYLRDLTERRAMEAKVAHQRDAISHNEKLGSMGALLANVAHELNNPLSVVIGRAELLREQELDSSVKRHTDRILTAAHRCADIVQPFLAAVRQKPPAQKTFSAAIPVSAAIDLVEHAFESSGIDLRVEVSPGLPALFGDDGQLAQVIANLLTNAQHAVSADPAPRQVTVSARHDEKSNTVIYAVADSGPGIADDVRSRIFEPFFTTKSEGSGTGVGLAIAHNIVKSHDGEIEVGIDAALGGALFELKFPAGISPNNSTDKEGRSYAWDLGRELRVLVIDDDAEVGRMIAELLYHEGLQSEVAASAETALSRMGTVAYDVILCDLRMPDLSGPALFETVRERWPGSERKFGFITGDSLDPAAARFIADVAAPVIEKPVSRDALLSFVNGIVTHISE